MRKLIDRINDIVFDKKLKMRETSREADISHHELKALWKGRLRYISVLSLIKLMKYKGYKVNIFFERIK